MPDTSDAPDIPLGLKKQEVIGSPMFPTRPVINKQHLKERAAEEDPTKHLLHLRAAILDAMMAPSVVASGWTTEAHDLWRPAVEKAFEQVLLDKPKERIRFPTRPLRDGYFNRVQHASVANDASTKACALIAMFDLLFLDRELDEYKDVPRCEVGDNTLTKDFWHEQHDIYRLAELVAAVDIAKGLHVRKEAEFFSGTQVRSMINRGISTPLVSDYTDPFAEWNYLETAIYLTYGQEMMELPRFSQIPPVADFYRVYSDAKYRRVVTGRMYDFVRYHLGHYGCNTTSPYYDASDGGRRYKTAFTPSPSYVWQVP